MEEFSDYSRVFIEAARSGLRHRVPMRGDSGDDDTLATSLNVRLVSDDRYAAAQEWCVERFGRSAITTIGVTDTTGEIVRHLYELDRSAHWASKRGGNFWFRDEDAAFEFKMVWG